jgi:hypothetical protein
VHPFYLHCGFSLAPDMLRRDRSRRRVIAMNALVSGLLADVELT